MKKQVFARQLEGIGDLVVSAPIKSGFIPAFETVTYRTRLEITLEALFKMRVTAREHSLLQPFPEIERIIESLLDFRLLVVDAVPDDMLLLTARFDRGWRPYMRLIWRPLGTFLDLVFCNCEGYVPASTHSFEEYAGWVASRQKRSDFFYSANALTFGDTGYLSKFERASREGRLSPRSACAMTADSPLAVASEVFHRNQREALELAFEALVGLHKLSSYYPLSVPDGCVGYKDSEHGIFLVEAARKFLPLPWNKPFPAPIEEIYREQLDWIRTAATLPAAAAPAPQGFDPSDVQGGILRSYKEGNRPITHGCLILLQVTDPEKAREYLASLKKDIQTAGSHPPADGIYVNVSMTARGLGNLGVPDEEFLHFPEEFRLGIETRAGLLGDVRGSHPRRWRLPPRNWPPGLANRQRPPVELAEIDLVIELRTAQPSYQGYDIIAEALHPLRRRVEAIATAAAAGMTVLSVESMRRAKLDPKADTDHFGIADGISQPVVEDAPATQTLDHVARGELLLGYPDDRGGTGHVAGVLQKNGSFLVVRKIMQDRAALESFLSREESRGGVTAEKLIAKMLGRERNGRPLVPATGLNDFTYDNDPDGEQCPLQSHIRRANPRKSAFQRPTPRIMRRGLSYGPGADIDVAGERGVMFMAYNASIAEQYEVIQRWINGGNPTGTASCQSDPMLGVAEDNNPRTFRFYDNGAEVRVDIPTPFAAVQWGMYLFVPSITAIDRISSADYTAEGASTNLAPRPQRSIASIENGDALIARFRALEAADGGGEESARRAASAWKNCLEDFHAKDPAERGDALDVWKSIRENHGGVIRVPYPSVAGEPDRRDAILVADKALVMAVFEDPEKCYTMCEHQARLAQSIGPIYLGLDAGPEYDRQATVPNNALMNVTSQDAFHVAYKISNEVLDRILDAFRSVNREAAGKLDLHARYITPVLAGLCRYLVGIPDGPQIAAGGWDGADPARRDPCCPGDFMAPSRYAFYPDPVPVVQRYGQDQGQQLRKRAKACIAAQRAAEVERARENPRSPPASLLMSGLLAEFPDDDLLARTVVGLLVGFLPPADATLRGIIYEWLENDGALWRLQNALALAKGDHFERAEAVLLPSLIAAMQKRPAPDLLWRVAAKAHYIRTVRVAKGDRVIIGISSATFADHEADKLDAFAIFGGDRSASKHGTHACPAYKFSIGAMLGILSALLGKGRIEAEPSPLIIKLTRIEPTTDPPHEDE